MGNRWIGRLGIVMAIAATIALAGCSGGSQPPVTPAATGPVRIAEADNGTTVALAVGQTLLVDLAANPSTGYSWVVTALPSVVETVGEPAFKGGPTQTTAVVGAGGVETLTFRAKAAGTGKLDLGYVRPWETGVAPAQTYSVTLEVK